VKPAALGNEESVPKGWGQINSFEEKEGGSLKKRRERKHENEKKRRKS